MYTTLSTLFRALLCTVVVLLVAACSDDEGGIATTGRSRVVVVYMMAENSLSSAAASDTAEIHAGATAIPAGSKMVVYIDNSSSTPPQILTYDNSGSKTVQYEFPADVISTDSATMVATLRRIVNSNVADEYALVLWSHGSGWAPPASSRCAPQKTIGIDNGENTSSNSGTEMAVPTLRGVLENVGVHWQYIFFDACFMQCVEVAYELREVTDWCIGSPAEIPGDGANYTRLMNAFFEETTFAAALTAQYFDTYKNSSGVLLSAMRSSEMDNLAAATADALSTCTDFPTDGIQQYCTYAAATGYKPEYYDIASSIYHWCGDDGYNTWSSAAAAAIPYRYGTTTWMTTYSPTFSAVLTDADHYAGASQYVPVAGRDGYNAAWRTYAWYAAAAHALDRP